MKHIKLFEQFINEANSLSKIKSLIPGVKFQEEEIEFDPEEGYKSVESYSFEIPGVDEPAYINIYDGNSFCFFYDAAPIAVSLHTGSEKNQMAQQQVEVPKPLNKLNKKIYDEAVADIKEYVGESATNEGWGMDDIVKLHFETDPDKQEELKRAYGKKTGAMSRTSQIESADYALAKYRRQIGYDNGKSGSAGLTDVFIPSSSMAAFSTVGNGPHSKPKKWNQKEYDKWIKDMAGDGGANHAYDMAQNAKFEPGLIDWVKKNVAYGEKPLDRIQWDIEAYS